MALSDFSYSLFPGYLNANVRAGTAAPTTGTWGRGDIVMNTAPSPSQVLFWVCTVAGTPGTWLPMSATPSLVSTQATIGAITGTPAFAILTSDAVGTYTLPKGSSYAPAFRLSIVVTSNRATTFAAASGDQVIGTVAVTAANAPLTFAFDGTSSWYRLNG